MSELYKCQQFHYIVGIHYFYPNMLVTKVQLCVWYPDIENTVFFFFEKRSHIKQCFFLLLEEHLNYSNMVLNLSLVTILADLY